MLIRNVLKLLLFAVGSLCYALLGVLSQLSKSPDGSYAYSMPSVVLVAEFVKLCISFAFLAAEQGSPLAAARAASAGPLRAWLFFAAPSTLYSLNNNLDMLSNQHMDPATEQVLVQLKILTTGLLWRLVFKKALGLRKWSALVLLFVGAACAGYPATAPADTSAMYIDSFGVGLIAAYVTFSALASVCTEVLYKGIGANESVHISNIRLYTIGIVFNLSMHVATKPPEQGLADLLHGYNRYTYGLVATYALMGLLLAQVMKLFDNIVKLFIPGCSVYISALLSWVIFGYRPTTLFLVSLGTVTVAVLLYNAEQIWGLTAVRKAE